MNLISAMLSAFDQILFRYGTHPSSTGWIYELPEVAREVIEPKLRDGCFHGCPVFFVTGTSWSFRQVGAS